MHLIPCFAREQDLVKLENKWEDKIQSLNSVTSMFANSFDLDFVLLDARTGYSQPGIVAACTSDYVVAVTRADNVSSIGMKEMLNAFRHRPMEKIILLITNIPGIISNDHPEIVSFVENMGKEPRQ